MEGRLYPRVILGSDRFLDIFLNPRPPWQFEEEYVFSMMKCAISYGIAGFDLSTMSENVLRAFQRLKYLVGDDAIGIGNPNWRCGYKLGDQHLKDIKPRIIRTLVENCISVADLRKIERLADKTRDFWFGFDSATHPLSPSEVRAIHIEESEWISRLNRLADLADFCLIGADYADWMLLLGRQDLLRWQIATIRQHGMVPVSVCHWTSLSLPKLDRMEVAAHWTLGNLEQMYLSTASAISAIRKRRKPVTCFRILRGIERPRGIASAIAWLRDVVGASSVVVGVDNEDQARYTLPLASEIMSAEAVAQPS